MMQKINLKRMSLRIVIVTFVSLLTQISFAQEQESFESLMAKMRDFAWEKQDYSKAIEIGEELLKRYPNNTAVEQFIGNLYFYTEQDSLASFYLENALLKDPGNMDIVNSLYHLKYKQGDYERAARLADRLIASDSSNVDYQVRKVQTYSAIGRKDEALSTLDMLEREYPENGSIKYLSEKLRIVPVIPPRILKNGIGVMYRQLNYSQGLDPKMLMSGRYIRKAGKATIVASGTYGKHYDNKGVLLESEMYYNHDKESYSHTLINWSNRKELFAQFNTGFSYFRHFGKGWVPGLGARYTYSNESHVYTALLDLSKYWGSNLTQARVYGIFDDGNFYQAYSFTHRYIFSSYNFLQLMYTLGTSPDDKTRLVESNLDFKAHSVSLFGNVRLFKNIDTRGYFTYTKQKISPTSNYSIYEFGLELIYNF